MEFVEERLDRACANNAWSELFPRANVVHLNVAYSDHDPIQLNIDNSSPQIVRRKRLQRFEEKWVAHTECEDRIRTSWAQEILSGSPMFRLFEKIKRCRLDLLSWSRVTFGDTRTKLNQKYRELDELTSGDFSSNLGRITEVKKSITELLHQEEVFWKQRSKAIWLPAGDKNTKFFHQRASHRRRQNHINGLHDGQGVWLTDEGRVAIIAEEYYRELFTSNNPMHMDKVLDSVDRVVTDGMNESLVQPYTEEEVRTALFQMHPSKTPGPNGMSPFFFQKYWHIVGQDVTSAVLSSLHSGRCLRKMNFTHIVLVPKVNDPQHITEFRPISLSNVVSRIVSTVLVNRLKTILPNVILDSQSAFVLGRLIIDNTTVAFEMLHRMRNRRRGRTGRSEERRVGKECRP